MKLTDKMIFAFWGETENYTDPNAFASDTALSVLDLDDPDQEIDMDLFEQLCTLWHVANDPFRELLKLIGLNQSQCSIRFCIPIRTVQGWAENKRCCPKYIRLMMAECTGIVKIR